MPKGYESAGRSSRTFRWAGRADCYGGCQRTAIQPSGEMSFSFLLRVFRGGQVSNPKGSRTQMQQSFRELGASGPVAQALAARSIHNPFRIQALALPDALGGLDLLVRAPTGSGK